MYKKGVITIEIMLALLLWAIFLTGILSLWFNLFGPQIPLFQYIEQETFFVNQITNMESNLISYQFTDRGIALLKSVTGLEFLKSNWQNAFGRRSCRFLNAEKLREVSFAPSIQLDGSNIASAMFVRGDAIFLTTNSGSTTDPDLYVISTVEKTSPVIISKLNTGPGLVGLTVAGRMVYVANTSINSQAQAIDISNMTAPFVKWSFKVPGSQGTSTALGRAIDSDGSHVFLGTAKSSTSELFILSPDSGVVQGEYEIGSGVNALYIDDSKLYVASPIDPELLVFDVSTSSVFKKIDEYDAAGGSGNGKSIEIFNNDIFLGRTFGGKELLWLKSVRSTSSSSTSIVVNDEKKINATVDAMISAKDILYVITGHAQEELQVWKKDRESGIFLLSQKIDLPSRAVGIGCSGEYLYVALNTNTPLLLFESDK